MIDLSLHEGLAETDVSRRSKNDSQYQRSHRIIELTQNVSEDTEDEHDMDVKDVHVSGICPMTVKGTMIGIKIFRFIFRIFTIGLVSRRPNTNIDAVAIKSVTAVR